MTNEEINAEIYAYQKCGSSPCEDCNEYRHQKDGLNKLYGCLMNGGCEEKIAYLHDYEMFRQEYLKRHNSK